MFFKGLKEHSYGETLRRSGWRRLDDGRDPKPTRREIGRAHVIVHSHATLKAAHRGDDSKGMNIIDTWKVEDGELVEHWDAVQGISMDMRLYNLFAGGKVRNTNGVF